MVTELLDQKVRITTGSGTVYELGYQLTERSMDFNVGEYDYLNTEGTFADRAEPRSFRFDLPLIFNAETHLTDVNEFIEAIKDKRPLLIEHPINGTRNMQPLSITVDSTPVIHSVVTLALVETLLYDGTLIQQSTRSEVLSKSDIVNETAIEESATDSITEQVAITATANTINQNLRDKVSFQDVANQYSDAFYSVNTTVGSIGTESTEIMQTISNMLLMPSKFINNMKDRIEFVSGQFQSFYGLVSNLSSIYSAQFFGASVISSLAVTSLPDSETEYDNVQDIDNVVQTIINTHNAYMNSMQSVSGFTMSYDIYQSLLELVIYTVNNLYDIALTMPTTVTVTTSADTSVFVLANKYGMTVDDMFKLNNWSVAQTIIIPAETQVKYYV